MRKFLQFSIMLCMMLVSVFANAQNQKGAKWQEVVFKSGETTVTSPVSFDTEGVTITTVGCEFMGSTLDVGYNLYEENEIDWKNGTKLVFTAKDNITGIIINGNFKEYAGADKGAYNNGAWVGTLAAGEVLTLTANDGITIKELIVLYNGAEYDPEIKEDEEGQITVQYPTANMTWATLNNGNKFATFTTTKEYAQVTIDVKDMEPNWDNGNYDFPTRMVDNAGENSDNLHVGENTVTAQTPDAKPWNFYKGHTYKMIVKGFVNMWDVMPDNYDAITEITFVGDGTPAPAISDITVDKIFPTNGIELPEGPRTVDLTFSAPVQTLKAVQPKGMEGSVNYTCTKVDEAGLIWNVNLGDLSIVSESGESSSITLEISGTDANGAVLNLGDNAARALQLQYTISKTATEPEHELDVQIVPAFILAGEESTLNDHSSVSVAGADALKAGFGDNGAVVKYATYSINELVEEEFMGVTDIVEIEKASGILNLNGFGYAEFEEPLVFNYGSKYNMTIKAWDSEDIFTPDFNIKEPIATFACEFNGSFVAPVNTIAADKYAVSATVTLDQNIMEEMVPAGFKKYIGSYKTNATLAGDEDALTISENKEGGLFEGFVIKGDAVAYDPSLVIVLDGKKFNVRGTDGSESGKLAIKATEDGYTMEEAAIWYNGKQVAIVSDIKINAVEPVIAYLENADFSEGVVGDVNIATYAKDGEVHQMQEVPGWSFGVENGDARAAGVVAYGSATTLGGAAYTVPAEGPEGTNGNALAMVGVWTGTVQYVQDATLPAGSYTMTVPVYNTKGTTAFVKNLIGVKYGETEVYATAKSYPEGKWTEEVITFSIPEETTVTVSLGYVGANAGSGASQHLFIDNVAIEAVDEVEAAKTAALAALPVADGTIFTPSASDIDAVKLAIMTAETVEEVEAAAATVLSIPALQGEYTIYNTTANNYLGTNEASVVLSAEPVAVTFEAIEGGIAIKVGESYINMLGTNTWSMTASAEAKTAWNFTLADGNYTINGPNGLIGSDNAEAGSLLYGNKTADKNGVWSIEAIIAPSIAAAINDSIELNTHSSVSAESVSSIKVAFDGINPREASYTLYSMIQVLGEEASSWEVNETLAQGELPVNGKGYAELEEPVVLEQGTKYQLVVNYTTGDGAKESVVYDIDGAYVAPVIADIAINGDVTLNSHSSISAESISSILVKFGNSTDIKEVSYVLSPMVQNDSLQWVPGVPAAFGPMSMKTYAYVEDLSIVLEQGTKYQLDINIAYLDGSDYTESYQIDGATEKEEPQPGSVEIAVVGNDVKLTFNYQEVSPSWNVAITLDGKNVDLAFDDDFNVMNVLWLLDANLADGDHTFVFPVGSLVINSEDNSEEIVVPFHIEGGVVTSISAIAATESIKEIFSANGAKLSSMQKGLNIVRLSNGSVKKIMVK